MHDDQLTALAERFCATELPDSVCADVCATRQGPGRLGTNLLTVAEAKAVLSHVFAAPNAPTESVKAPKRVTMPADMRPWAGGAMKPADWPRFGRVMYRNGHTSQGATDYDWSHTGTGYDIIAYTPASPTPITADDAVAKERERCARIAEQLAKRYDYSTNKGAEQRGYAARDIAAAIRSLSPDTEGEG